jgi:hypothetical protein
MPETGADASVSCNSGLTGAGHHGGQIPPNIFQLLVISASIVHVRMGV